MKIPAYLRVDLNHALNTLAASAENEGDAAKAGEVRRLALVVGTGGEPKPLLVGEALRLFIRALVYLAGVYSDSEKYGRACLCRDLAAYFARGIA